ncbi:DUF4433 domain-containing protein [candidate division BRC1 bacterium HGW-BRC1-1]|nr:MAG: DUF4433 domain-containing protein [candidate division BRC1 bacterium HGW-BRC1-1]
MSKSINPEKALIFRIVHLRNVEWIFQHGLYCRNSETHDPNYVNIGNIDLIDKRAKRLVPIPPGGTLSDYVPFYFTPFSIMMYNIKTGYGGITKRENCDIVIFVSSIQRLRELGLPFLFTNQHAYLVDTEFMGRDGDLGAIDWALLQNRDFETDYHDPGKQARYQAEALVHNHVPLEALLGIGCHDDKAREELEMLVRASCKELTVKVTPGWYF